MGANHLFMPEAQHQNFEECTILDATSRHQIWVQARLDLTLHTLQSILSLCVYVRTHTQQCTSTQQTCQDRLADRLAHV